MAEAVEEPTWVKECTKCGAEISRYRGMYGVTCTCGAEYNAFGQRLRDDYRSNPSLYNEDIGDMEGFEMSQLAKEDG